MSHFGRPWNGAHFARMDASADPQSAAQIRREFAEWLRRYFTFGATKANDVVLAVYEAMANAAEFAYATVARPGAMHVLADNDRTSSSLIVTVTDEGAWLSADPTTRRGMRGRGIPLMHALADRATVHSSQAGTKVYLEWGHVGLSPAAVTG